MKRDGLSEDQALARVAAQMPIRKKAAVADYVIDTSAGLEEVRERTREVLRAIRSGAFRTRS